MLARPAAGDQQISPVLKIECSQVLIGSVRLDPGQSRSSVAACALRDPRAVQGLVRLEMLVIHDVLLLRAVS